MDGLSLLRTTSWTLTQVGLEVSKVEVTFRTLGALGMSLHLSPTSLPHLSPTLGALGRMSSHLSPTCPSHLSPTLGALCRMSLHLSPTLVFHTCLVSHSVCLRPHEFALVSHLSSTLVFHSECLGPHEFTLVSYACFPYLSSTLGALGRFYICLPLVPHLSPTLVSHLAACVYTYLLLIFRTCLPLWVPSAASFYTCLPLVPHTLGSLDRMSLLHLSSTCLPK